MKGQGVHTLTLVIMIVIIFFAAIVVYEAWVGNSDQQISAASCATQQINFCTKWWTQSNTFDSANQPTWTTVAGCSQPGSTDCQNILHKS